MDKETKKFIRFLKRMGAKEYNGIGFELHGFSISFYEDKAEVVEQKSKENKQNTAINLYDLMEKSKSTLQDRSNHVPEQIKRVNTLFEAAGVKVTE